MKTQPTRRVTLAVGALALMVLALAPAQATPLVTNGLKGYWSFDASSAVDDNGIVGPHDGTPIGTVTWNTDTPPGFPGKSADFGAKHAANCVKVSTDGGLNSFFDLGSAFSVSYWRKGAIPDMWRPWVGKDGDGPGGFRIISNANSSNLMGLGQRGPGDGPWGIPISTAADRWLHYAITYGGGYARIYENGVLLAQVNKTGAMNATKGALCIGAQSDGNGGAESAPYNFSGGMFDEVYVFDRPLTAAEVLTLLGPSGNVWDGGTGDWSASNWSGGNPPTTGASMFIDKDPSSVTLSADFSADSLALGATAPNSALTINGGTTLTLATDVTVGQYGTLLANGTLNFGGSGSVLTLRGALTYNSGTEATPGVVKFYPGSTLAGSGTVRPTSLYQVYETTTVAANLPGASASLDVMENSTATLSGTNDYTGQTYVRGGARLNAVDGVGLPSLSNLRLVDNSTMAFSGDLIRPSGTGAGQMQVSARHAHSAYGGPARLGFGTKVGAVITLENLVWNSGYFQHSEGWYIQRGDATHPIEIMNPIDLATGGGTKPRAIFIQSGTQPVIFSGVLSGAGGALKLSQDFGTSSTATMILTAKNTYTGNTEVQRGKLILADNAELRFVTGDTAGVNNTLTGAGTAQLDGDFCIDTALTDASALTAGTWQLENVPSLTGAYGSTFQVVDSTSTPWTDAGGDTWTKTVGAKRYTFAETDGTLTLTEFIRPTGALLLVK